MNRKEYGKTYTSMVIYPLDDSEKRMLRIARQLRIARDKSHRVSMRAYRKELLVQGALREINGGNQ